MENINNSVQCDVVSNEVFIERIKDQLNSIIKNEPLLSDMETIVDIDELNTLLSLEHGESMNLFVKRADDKLIKLIVKQTARVSDLKRSIQAYFKSSKGRKEFSNVTQVINWKYMWRNYSLMYGQERLLEDTKSLRDYGIKNRSELVFSKNEFRKRI